MAQYFRVKTKRPGVSWGINRDEYHFGA